MMMMMMIVGTSIQPFATTACITLKSLVKGVKFPQPSRFYVFIVCVYRLYHTCSAYTSTWLGPGWRQPCRPTWNCHVLAVDLLMRLSTPTAAYLHIIIIIIIINQHPPVSSFIATKYRRIYAVFRENPSLCVTTTFGFRLTALFSGDHSMLGRVECC